MNPTQHILCNEKFWESIIIAHFQRTFSDKGCVAWDSMTTVIGVHVIFTTVFRGLWWSCHLKKCEGQVLLSSCFLVGLS